MLDQRTIERSTYDWHTESIDENRGRREAAYALLRVALSMIFLVSGVGKFMMGVGAFAAHMQEDFAGKLPAAMVSAFAYALPFAEVAIGALLLLGLFNAVTLTLAGLLMIALTFGVAMKPDPPTMSHNMFYAFVIFVLMWFGQYNGYSVDRLARGSRPLR